jgi:hypothetical protein
MMNMFKTALLKTKFGQWMRNERKRQINRDVALAVQKVVQS